MNARNVLREWPWLLIGIVLCGALYGAWMAFDAGNTRLENIRLREAAATKLRAEWTSGRFKLKVEASARPDETPAQLSGRLREHVTAGASEFPPEE